MQDIGIEAIKGRLSAGANYSPKFSVDAARETWYAYTEEFKIPSDIAVHRETVDGRTLEFLHRAGAGSGRVLLYLHGGGYVCGGIESHRPITCEFAKEFDGHVASLDYRLAPEAPFPAAVDDTVAAYRHLLDSGFEPSSIAFGGESAGGGLAIGAMIAIGEQELPLPAAAWCISPWTDLGNTARSIDEKAAYDPIVFRNALEVTAGLYLGARSPDEPAASPALADLRGFPAILIQVGSSEILMDDALALARAAGMADVDVRLEIWAGMIHAWHLFSEELEAGRRATAVAADWVNQHTRATRDVRAIGSGPIMAS